MQEAKMKNPRNKKYLPGVYVYQTGPGESKPELVATFFTHYRARKTVVNILAREAKAKDCTWDIRTSIPA
jgi:hypothetical protein